MKKVTKGSKNRLEKELGFRSFGNSLSFLSLVYKGAAALGRV